MINSNLNKWLKYGERGISSEAIASHLTGINFVSHHWFDDYPLDPSDFRRCLELLNCVPEFIPRLKEMKTRSPVWARLIENWDELHKLYVEEYKTGKCPKLFDRMQELIELGRKENQ